jgi:catechol 2,3-dioxygenase-like lactoylglutathione lyase family enzyme
MLHHISVGVSDVERAARFYDAVLGALGFKRTAEYLPYAVAYGDTGYSFWVQLPRDRVRASAGNGVHVAFNAKNKRAVQAFHRAALMAGGTDEGPPGPRPDYGPDYYGAFVCDLDGNKIEAVVVIETVSMASVEPKPRTKAKRKKAGAKKKTAKRKATARRTAARKPSARKPAPKRKAKRR